MARLSKALFLSSLALCARAAAAQVAPLVPAVAMPASDDAAAIDESSTLWFVELSGAPVADGNTVAATRAEKAAFRSSAAKAGLRLGERQAFDTLFNGLAVSVARADVGKLLRLDGVKAIYPVQRIPLPAVSPISDPALATAVQMTGADVVRTALGFTGLGVKVAVMDTGIDYHHADLGGNGVPAPDSVGFPSARVVAGFDFVGDAYNADDASPTFDPVPRPDPFPLDCNGHGTHVSGIIGANGKVTGVAPGVTFGAYRVFGCEGSTTADIMLAAMERAFHDKMDVLNMSIGSAFQWPQYPTAQAASRLAQKGMVVVASIGNEGASGLWSASAPGLGSGVIGVAAYDNTRQTFNVFTVSPDDRAVGYNRATGAPISPVTGTGELARTGTPTTANDGCDPLPAGSLVGKIALIRRGTCTFFQKAFNAQSAGAVAVVLYNNQPGRVLPTVVGAAPITIPVVSITAADGVEINNRIAAGPTQLTWTDGVATEPVATGGLISSFSSYGLSPDLALKPDLGAPGGLIWSTFPLVLGSYASLSGTSMSSPHVAGAAALLLEARPKTSPAAVKTALQNSAVPAPWFGNPGLGFLDVVGRQGAGMIHIDRSILSTTTVEPSSLALGESQAGPQARTLLVFNGGDAPVTYDLSHAPGLAVARTFTPAFFDEFATVEFSQASVTVPPRSFGLVGVTVTAPAAPALGQYGGWLVLTAQGTGEVLRVPYAGFIGDYQAIQVLAPTGFGFPWLAKVVGTSLVKQADGATFTLANGDLPVFILHLDHPSRSLRARVLDAATGTPARPAADAFREEFLPRNSSATGFFTFAWDGTAQPGNATLPPGNSIAAAPRGPKFFPVPNGTYVVEFTVLKALGDPANPAHVETWLSPSFTIARP